MSPTLTTQELPLFATCRIGGKPSFQTLQHLLHPRQQHRRILYFTFDLLNWEGKSLLKLPLMNRKRHLELALARAPARFRFTEWTRDGQLRHPVFERFRVDKAAWEVVREP